MTASLPPLPDLFGNPILRGINEVLPPAPIDWLPQTPGWYGVGALLAALLIRHLWRHFRRWLRNRYRREALRELEQLTAEGTLSPLPVNALLKRTAIISSSREEVAQLSGKAWTDWLQTRIDSQALSAATLEQLGDSLYDPGRQTAPDTSLPMQELAAWVSKHRDDHAPA